MNSLIDAALGHARTVLATLTLLLIAGTYAYLSIPKEAEPDVNIPIVYVSLSQSGISPEDAERLLIRPMEQELTAIEGKKEMRSTAYLGGGMVLLEFEAGFDVATAMADVREKVDIAKAELPGDADEPRVHEVNLSLFPVLVVTLGGKVPERSLLRIARELRDRIEGIPTVLEAEIGGDREELVELIVDPLVLESYGLNAPGILESVSRNNRVVAAGEMDTGRGRFPVTVPGLFEDVNDILNMPVKTEGDAVIRFRDVGHLNATFKDPEDFARVNGKPALALEISKRTGTNIIETIEAVKALIERERASWPAGLEVSYSQDKSTQIATMLSDLQNNVLSAIILVMVVIVAALGLRSAGLVGVAIPGSFLTGILVLAVAGLTVNIVVLFSLILAVGMLVDGAIVVTEYADRKLVEGLPRREAYALAAKRMAWPIIAATATTLAAFLPLLFWPGLVGEFMKFLPITLLATLTASLFMALIFVPTLGSLVGKSGAPVEASRMRALAAGESGDLSRLGGVTGAYIRVLRATLRHPGKILLASVALLVAVQFAYATFGRGVEFFPSVEPENVSLWVHGRGNLSIHERDALLREVEQQVLELQAERGEFHSIYARSVASSGQTNDEEPEDLVGTIQLEFVDWFARRGAEEILAEIRERSAHLAGISIELREQEAGPPVGKPIQIQVSSSDPARIEPTIDRILGVMADLGGFIDLEDGRPVPGIEWEMRVDRAQAAKFDADVQLVGSYVQMATRGLEIGNYRPDRADEEIDIVVRLPEDYRNTSHLDRIRVQTENGLVPIANFITLRPEPKTSLLRRVDGNRAMTIRSDVAPGILADDKVQELRAALAGVELDPMVSVTFRGEDEEQRAAGEFLSKAFLVALFLMAIILVTQFNSFYSTGLILSAVVMSTIGVMLGLLITGQPFGIVMSGIGVIALAGIVVNNNIVLIDTFDRLKQEASEPFEAILRTGAQRLRPVLLTTITTILGLMPMVLGVNVDFFGRNVQFGAPSTQWWQQLATAIAFGLAFSTLLTLIFTPCALMFRANIQSWRARRQARKQESPPGGVARLRRAAE
ncbi:efflux RND transporter permease subunit [Aquibaculum arenosum]|uniref:Efflux RND transporter permease subunit n=1 Tax=Aquibaculum arenosum TaxID=3032591 RepID=A0ABT5YM39_9PROT|nr:efflux RND transporter permease subunit [Fodinicurvata sp. CAU 1616]MDF2096030.1 efflux RND transporter permease subunit [Fodinicurvata sp. CAU 1616]